MLAPGLNRCRRARLDLVGNGSKWAEIIDLMLIHEVSMVDRVY